jgi:hypothetical protein
VVVGGDVFPEFGCENFDVLCSEHKIQKEKITRKKEQKDSPGLKKKRKEKTTQTMSAWVKEVWMPQNLWEAVGPHYRGGGSAPC